MEKKPSPFGLIMQYAGRHKRKYLCSVILAVLSVVSGNMIEFRNVTFSYDDEKEALKKISLTIPEGKVTALVGASGSGKSTVAKLIAGFWDVTEGELLIGGVNVRNIPLEAQAERIAYVEQNNFLFNDTVMENIRMGRAGATDEDVIAAAKAAGCDEFIRGLDKGYHTVVGSAGGHLSGGERQRIAIARAMLKDAPIVILDEATAYIDPENEAMIQKAIAKLVQGKTVIVVLNLFAVVIMIVTAVLYKNGSMELANAVMMFVASFMVFEQRKSAGISIATLRIAESSIDKANETDNVLVMDEGGRDIAPETHDIAFENVDFSYGERKILDGISFAVKEKTTTAIVGPSGSGKSTTQIHPPDGGTGDAGAARAGARSAACKAVYRLARESASRRFRQFLQYGKTDNWRAYGFIKAYGHSRVLIASVYSTVEYTSRSVFGFSQGGICRQDDLSFRDSMYVRSELLDRLHADVSLCGTASVVRYHGCGKSERLCPALPCGSHTDSRGKYTGFSFILA